MILLKKDTSAIDNREIANTIRIYFTNVVKSLEILDSENINQFYEWTQTPSLKAIVKFKKRLSIKTVNDSFTNWSFNFCNIEDVINEIIKINSRKTRQDTDIPVNILKENADFFWTVFA